MEERKPIKNFEAFKAFMKEEQKSGRWSHIVTRTLTEEKPNELIIHSSECLIAKMFKEMNAVDLGLIMCCNTDFATAKIYHPKLKLRQTKTLMKDDYCEKIYYWEMTRIIPIKPKKAKFREFKRRSKPNHPHH